MKFKNLGKAKETATREKRQDIKLGGGEILPSTNQSWYLEWLE